MATKEKEAESKVNDNQFWANVCVAARLIEGAYESVGNTLDNKTTSVTIGDNRVITLVKDGNEGIYVKIEFKSESGNANE